MGFDLIGKSIENIARYRSGEHEKVWRNTSDLYLILLYFAAQVGVFTAGQAVRYVRLARPDLWKRTHEEVHEALDALVKERGWLGRLAGYAFPTEHSGAVADVFYLQPSGKKRAEKRFLSAVRHIRKGRPTRAMRARVPHDVDVTEAFLWVLSSLRVLVLVSENELKSLIKKALEKIRGQTPFDGESGPDEVLTSGASCATGDFMVFYQDGNGGLWWSECEVVRKLSYWQIKDKPDHIAWFVRGTLKSDVVEAAKGVKSVIFLGDVCEPCFSEACAHAPRASDRLRGSAGPDVFVETSPPAEHCVEKLTDAQKRLIREIGRLGMATNQALGAALGIEASGVRKHLSKLEKLGHVVHESVHLHPGRQKGPRSKLYRLANPRSYNGAPLAERRQRLLISHLIIAHADEDFVVREYDAEFGVLKLHCLTRAGEAEKHYVVDDTRIPVEELHRRVVAASECAPKATLMAVVADAPRAAELGYLIPREAILDLSKPAY